MKKRLGFLLAVALTALSPGAAQAHPLGNFTVNRYARLELRPGAIDVFYVLDLAEIPSFQEIRGMDEDGDGRASEAELERYAARKAEAVRGGLSLAVNGTAAELRTVHQRASLEPGQAGLSTVRLEAMYSVVLTEAKDLVEVGFRDNNEHNRPGWREIVVQAGQGVHLLTSTTPSQDLSDALRTYPDDLLSSPPDRREARFSYQVAPTAPGRGDLAPTGNIVAAASPGPVTVALADGLAIAALASGDLGPGPLLFALLAAAGLGAAHALSPGHGKTIVAAYLVGSRGTVPHALLLGLTVTATHTAAVYALGGATLLAAAYVLPERLYSWLAASSGALVLLVGGRLLITRVGHLLQQRRGHHHHHQHGHDHGPSRTDLRGLLALGISGGLLPCPSALMLMLSAIALQQAALGLVLTAAFSVGLALVLVGVGTAIVLAGRALPALPHAGALPRLAATLPVLGALVVILAGAALTLEGIARLG